jgi:hypothetical protein
MSAAARAEMVVCHIDYGGETRRIEAHPTTTPLTVPTVQIGSYFLFRLVYEKGAAIKTTVYADQDDGPLPLHQAVFPHPVRKTRGKPGFSGLHFVYEPIRDGELEFWCERR